MQDVDLELKTDAARCSSLGRQIIDLEDERKRLTNSIHRMGEDARGLQNRITTLSDKIIQVTLERAALEAILARKKIVTPTTELWEITRRLDELKRQHDRAQAKLDRLRPQLHRAELRRSDVEHITGRLRSEFNRLGCSVGFLVR